ncbi:MAG: hypothetical protein K2J77_11675 [Oscillospiraceae bacterium]|nr:hypothetical protein [Oscillospiraceae bacterium]
MRRHGKCRRRGSGCNSSALPILAAAAFITALICLVVFSAKCILLFVAVLLIALGVFLLRL